MDKKQLAAALALGVALGAGGKGALDAALTPAAAALSTPTVHALDLRRDYSGSNLHFTAYGNRAQGDGGFVDLNQPKRCRVLDDAAQKQLVACMNAAGSACEW